MNIITPEIETEAAVYAEGTSLSKADILKAYRQHGEEIDIQRFCEQVLKIENDFPSSNETGDAEGVPCDSATDSLSATPRKKKSR